MLLSTKAWYIDWFNSPFYHRLYFERNRKEAESFIQNLLAHLRPKPGSSMLDIACGRGRHSKILAGMGFNVTGIDLSPDNIKYAKQFETVNLEFFQHDMRFLFRINYFEYTFNFFTSFGYFNTRRENEDAIRTMVSGLNKKGTLVIDYLNVHFAEDHLEHNEEKKIGDTLYKIHRWDEKDYFFKKLVITDPTLKEPLQFTERVAKFRLGDFNDMLSYYDMQVQEVFGDYQLNPYETRKTPRLILIARRRQIHDENHSNNNQKRLYSDGRREDALT